jgi:hypothetical protein
MKFYETLSPLFDAEGAGGAGAPAPAPVGVTPPAAEPLSPSAQLANIWDKGNAPAAVPPKAETPVTPPPQAPLAENSVQIPAVDTLPVDRELSGLEAKYKGNPAEFVKAFQNIQTSYDKDHQALLSVQKVLESERTAKADLETKLQTLSQPPKAPELPAPAQADEFAGLDAEGILEKFYADPVGVLSKIAEKVADSKVKPLESKFAPFAETVETQQHIQLWDEAATELIEIAPDIGEFKPGMKQYIAENNLSGSKNPAKVLKDAYIYAKGLNYKPQVDPKSYLNDENFMNENIYNNPVVKEKIMKEHLAGVRGQQNQLPNSIAGQSNSGSPAMPPVSLKGKPMRDVHEAAAAMLFGAK